LVFNLKKTSHQNNVTLRQHAHRLYDVEHEYRLRGQPFHDVTDDIGFSNLAKKASMTPKIKFSKLAFAFFSLMLVSACGGGGGGGGASSPVTPPTSGGTPSWTSGVFQAASTFKDRCETVRTGFDIEGNRFTDLAGSALQEKNWLRSWTNETYLWNSEVVDRDPALSNSRTDYFALLRTFAKTPSGKDKDDFHFSELTTEFLKRRNSAASAGYGARLVALSTSVPRDYRVQYTEPNSPASELTGGIPKLMRGTRILSINGVDLVNGGTTQAQVDVINQGLFPSTAGVTTTFVVQDPGATSSRTISLTSANLSQKPVNRTQVLTTPSGKVGYVLFNTFSPVSSETEIVNAIQTLQSQGISDLVLDLRYNGGGLLAVASQLSYMVAGDARTTGKIFERTQFNARSGNLNPVTGQINSPVPFYKTGLGFSVTNGTALPTLNLPRVFVLSTENTCSASESVVNGLRGIGVDVVLIGGKTCGKPYGFYPTDNCGQTYYSIQFQGVNDVGFGDYADGFIPLNSNATTGVRMLGCAVSDDLTRELGNSSEALLAAALSYRSSGSCPVPPASASAFGSGAPSGMGGQLVTTSALRSNAISVPGDTVMSLNRDMRMPGD
jgi:carboxyl-terminal processing protease